MFQIFPTKLPPEYVGRRRLVQSGADMDNPDQGCSARLREAEVQPGLVARLQAALNVIPAHTWYAAPSGGLTFVNKPTADYLGLPKDHPLRFGIDIGASIMHCPNPRQVSLDTQHCQGLPD